MIQALHPVASDGELYEVVNGVRVVKLRGVYETVLAADLFHYVSRYAATNRLDRATAQALFDQPNVDDDRRPDVAFVSFARWPQNRRPLRANAWPVVPELAAEVVSPTDDVDDVMEKVVEYFRAGVRVVWLVLPRQERVYVYTSPTDVRILARSDELTGDPVLPGFRLALNDLFPPPDGPDEVQGTAP